MGLASDIDMIKKTFKVQTGQLYACVKRFLGACTFILWPISSIPHYANLCNYIYQGMHPKLRTWIVIACNFWCKSGFSNVLYRSFGNIHVWNFTRWWIVEFCCHVHWIESRALCESQYPFKYFVICFDASLASHVAAYCPCHCRKSRNGCFVRWYLLEMSTRQPVKGRHRSSNC